MSNTHHHKAQASRNMITAWAPMKMKKEQQ